MGLVPCIRIIEPIGRQSVQSTGLRAGILEYCTILIQVFHGPPPVPITILAGKSAVSGHATIGTGLKNGGVAQAINGYILHQSIGGTPLHQIPISSAATVPSILNIYIADFYILGLRDIVG